MNNAFILNSSAPLSSIQDAIDERITKVKAITACLLAVDEVSFNHEMVRDTIWTIDGLLEELDFLYHYLRHL